MATAKQSTDLTSNSNPFQKPTEWSDVVFVVQGKKLHFNKAVLSMCSPVFNCMFTADFAEKGADNIKLPGKKYPEMVEFFKHMHPVYAAATIITDDTLQSLLELSREYQVEHIRAKCEEHIGKIERTVWGMPYSNRLLFYLWLCDHYELTKHRQKLVESASGETTRDLISSENFKRFPSNAAMDVLVARCRRLDRS